MELNLQNTKKEILYWAKRLYEQGMSPACSGNISCKFEKNILISATGTCLNDMNEDDIVSIDYNGNLVDGDKKPSSEKIMHSEIYTKRDDVNAIIHCHCPLITAFAVSNVPMKKPIIPDFAFLFDEVPVVPYACPSSIELATSVGEMFDKGFNAVLMQNHGVVLGSDSLKNAFYQLEVLKMYSETYFGAEVLGGIKPISKKNVLEIKQLRKKN